MTQQKKTSLVEQLQEEAREKYPIDSFYGYALIDHEDLDTLVASTVRRTLEELEKRIPETSSIIYMMSPTPENTLGVDRARYVILTITQSIKNI